MKFKNHLIVLSTIIFGFWLDNYLNQFSIKYFLEFIKNKRRKLIQDFGEVLDMPSKDEDQLENGAFLYQTQKQIIDKYKSIEDFIIQIEKENGNWNKNFQTGQ